MVLDERRTDEKSAGMAATFFKLEEQIDGVLLGPEGIRVNAVAPSLVDRDLATREVSGAAWKAALHS